MIYSVSNVKLYFSCVIEKHETVTGNPMVRSCVSKTENRITFKIKTGYFLERLTPVTMKLLGNSGKKDN